MKTPTLRWNPTTVVLGLFVLLGGLEALGAYAAAVQAQRAITLGNVLESTLPSWTIQLLLAWPVRWLSRHARLGPATWLRNLPIHVLAALAFVVVSVLGSILIFKQLGDLGTQPVSRVFARSFFAFLANQVGVYIVMVGAFHALDYLRESEQRERERTQLAASLTEARLHALRSQLSPHFFFNTLNAISTFSLQGRPEQVSEMVGALGDLVRASLDEDLPHQVPLRRELSLLDLYLEIQRLRFVDWLGVEEEIAADTLEVLVPSLMLQPLVENAIEHGGHGADGLNRVVLRGTLAGERLTIEIENPAPAHARATAHEPRLGVGLRNTRERLAQLYPGAHEFQFGVQPGRGFVTTLRIPARRGTPDASNGGGT